MFYGFLADVILAVHVVYVGFVVVGLLLILLGILFRWEWIRNPWFRFIHLVMILIVAFEALIQYQCPLTTWEADMRRLAGQEASDMTFVGRMLEWIMFYPPSAQPYLEMSYYLFALLILATFLIAPPRFRRRKADPLSSQSAPTAS